jgi:drug/metabolite transporter (DMT)-like permease
MVTRWQQAGLALVFLVVGFVAAAIGDSADQGHVQWLSDLMVWAAGNCAGGVMVFFGRAVLVGRARRCMFRYDKDADHYGRHAEPPARSR